MLSKDNTGVTEVSGKEHKSKQGQMSILQNQSWEFRPWNNCGQLYSNAEI